MSSPKKISDEGFISRFFWNLSSQKEISASVLYNETQIEGIMFFTARRGNEPNLRINNQNMNLLVGQNIEITFYNSEVVFFFQCEITSLFKDILTISMPSVLSFSSRRLMPRHRISEDDKVYVKFVKFEEKFEVFDISTIGVAFISHADIFSLESVHTSVSVVLNNDKVLCCEGVIKHVRTTANGKYIYGMSFENMELSAKNLIFQFTFAKNYSRLIFLNEVHYQDIINLYEKSHYFDFIYKEFQKNFYIKEMNLKNFFKISEDNTITSGIVLYKSEQPIAMGSVLRIYNRTFIGHQIISTSETKLNTEPIKEVNSGLSDFMINHPCFEYYISYFILDVQRLQEYYLGVESIINDIDKYKVEILQCIECSSDRYTTLNRTDGFECNSLDSGEAFIEFCKSRLDYIEYMSYSYNETQLQLSEIKQIYNARGLYIDRRIWCIQKDGAVAAYAVAECYTEGINLHNSLDILRVYFVSETFDVSQILDSLMPEAIVFYKKNMKDIFNIHLKILDSVAKEIKIPGLRYCYPVGRVLSNMGGMIEYKKLLNGGLISLPRCYKLTHPQLSIWYTEKVYPGTSFGNIAEIVLLKDKLDIKSLEEAINLVIQNNSGLRLRFSEEDGKPRQYESKYNYLNIDFFDFSLKGGLEALYDWDEYKNGACFKLLDSDLFYFAIFRVDENNCGFYIKTHHLISDAWTIANLLISKIVEDYSLLKNNVKPDKRFMPSYLDYISREEEYKDTLNFVENKEFWRDRFETIPELMSLKPLSPRYRDMKAKRMTFSISEELTSQIIQYSKFSGNSPFTIFLSVLSISINKLTSKNDLVLATPVLNRTNIREKETVGMFISIVPIRLNIREDISFEETVNNVASEWKQVLKNQKYPYDLILSGFRDRHKTNDKLYDIVLSYQNAKHEKSQIDYSTEWVFTGHQTDSLVIHISDRDGDGYFKFDFDYLVSVFKDFEIEQLYKLMVNIVTDVIENPLKKTNEIVIISEEEKHKLLYEFNDTAVNYSKEKTVQELFERQVEITPNNIALVFNNNDLTYQELNKRSNQLARVLREKGVGPDIIVGIMVERSFNMVIGILSVLKAGGAYLPLDSEYPFERIKYMLEDSKAKLLITQTTLFNSELFRDTVICIDENLFVDQENSNLLNLNKSNDLAYLIYTSGSTGKPKGVMLEHKGMANLEVVFSKSLCISEKDRVIQFASSSFDASVWEIFMSLFTGAALYIPSKDIINNTILFENYLNRNSITIATLPPPYLSYLVPERVKTIKKLITAGSAIPKELLERWVNKVEYVNAYGPTETTICATLWKWDDLEVNKNTIPIGKPIYNTKICILDKNNCLVPIGVDGELCIYGDTLARGYINKSDLTAEKFILHPYVENQRIYKTGDLAKWRQDGNIEFLGRIDHQVKIRGFRVELGEIENSLLRHESILEVVVIDKFIYGKAHLCAYIVTEKDLPIATLRELLSKELPEFMIPTYFIKLSKIPHTSSGKVDRKLLPDPECNSIKTNYVEPISDLEKLMARIWKEVLGVERVGIEDDFFELGGDSLAVIRVMTSVYSNNWDITIQDFYKHKTIKNICKKITGTIKLENTSEDQILNIVDRNEQTYSNNDNKKYEKSQFKRVLLTGATGFLGIHILGRLLIESQTKVFCLVRGENELNSTEKLKDLLFFYFKDKYTTLINERLFIINGDITLKNFGLSESDYNNLGQKVDLVFHSAALVKHYGEYREFRKTNVLGTKNVIDFSIKFNMEFCHISTTSISGTINKNNSYDTRFTENDFYIGQNYENNMYVKSKFEAENIVFKAIKKGLNAMVFRVGNLTGRYCDGYFQENIKENNFYQVLKSIIELGFISTEMLDWDIEFTPIDFCSKAIVDIVEKKYSPEKVFHIFNHNSIKVSDFINILRSLKIDIIIYENSIFQKRFCDVLSQEDKNEKFSGLINYFNLEKTIGNEKPVKISSDMTLEYLEQMDFYWPEINSLYLEKILKHMKSVSFLCID